MCINNYSRSPIYEQIREVKRLLEKGIDPNFQNYQHNSVRIPLFEAVKRNNVEMVKLLLEYGADPYKKYKNICLDAFDYAKSDEILMALLNNKYLKLWLSKMRDESENGILMAIKYHPDNFEVWREELEPDNSLLIYW